MAWIAALGRELFGLFVDDVPFSAAIVGWVAVDGWLLPTLSIDTMWDALLLAAGCALILLASTRRAAIRHRRTVERER
jgi:hypothetical protein